MPSDRKNLRASLQRAYEEGRLFKCVDEVRDAIEPSTYWGNWLVENTIVLLSGSGGISKTTFVYALLSGLIDDGEFLGVRGKRNIKVLYLDLESERYLIKARMSLLGRLEINHPNFRYCNLISTTFKDLQPYIDRFVKDYWRPNILVIDPLSLAFPTTDENDNAKATKEMQHIREQQRRWKTTIILVSHSGKADIMGVGHNRGASARPNLADITWNFHSLGQEYSENLFFFDIPKNRYIHDGFFECIEKQEGEFIVVPVPENYQPPKLVAGTKTYELQEKIRNVLSPIIPMDKTEILEALEMVIAHGSSEDVIFHRALTALQQRGEVQKISRGKYLRNANITN